MTEGGPDEEREGDADREPGGEPARSDPEALAMTYYRALDGGDYELLSNLLAPEFVHERPDRTLDGRERFVRFMRDERPQTDTSHPIDGIYVPTREIESADSGRPAGSHEPAEVVVRGRLLASDGSEITRFVDVFRAENGVLASLRTFTD